MNPSPVVNRPTFRARILALLVDYALIVGWMAALAIVTWVIYLITGRVYNWLELGTWGAQGLGFLVLVLPVGIYLYTSEASTRQATVGKRVLKLRVVDAATGGRPARWRIALRTIVRLLPWEIAHFALWNIVAMVSAGGTTWPRWLLTTALVSDVLPVIYVLVVAFQRERRGPHDLVAGTRVVADAPARA